MTEPGIWTDSITVTLNGKSRDVKGLLYFIAAFASYRCQPISAALHFMNICDRTETKVISMVCYLNKFLLQFVTYGLLLFPLSAYSFCLITYNLAEISDKSHERVQRLLLSIAHESPDAVFLQEASYSTHKQVKSLPAFNDYQYLDQSQFKGSPDGGLVILLKKPFKASNLIYTPLPSDMNRGLLSITITLGGLPHKLVNLHLESSDLLFWRVNYFRKQQIQLLSQLADSYPAVIIAGDFNLWINSEFLSPVLQDVWQQLNPNDPGLTWEPKTNSFAWNEGGFILSGGRFDRILFKSPVLTANRIERIGINVYPPLSDHYGLVSTWSEGVK